MLAATGLGTASAQTPDGSAPSAAKTLETFKLEADKAPVLVVLPSTAYEEGLAPLPLIVMLHGYGASIDDVAPVFRALAERVGAVLAVPQAVERAGPGYGWGRLDEAEYLVMRAIDVARTRALVAPRRIVLAGFSQGASVAYAVGLRHPETFAGVIAIAGRYDERAAPVPSPLPKRMPRFVVMCGGADRGVERSREAAAALEAAGLRVRLRIFEGVGHEFPPNILSELQDAVRFAFR